MPTLKIEVWGDRALFTRPEFKVEKVSYDVMTPSAARNILQAIYWHPGMRYIIKSISVLAPIKYQRVKTNGVKDKLSKNTARKAAEGKMPASSIKPLYTTQCAQQSTAMYLKDVHYVIEAIIVMTDKANPSDNLNKFYAMARRRTQKGQYYHKPWLGTRECPAEFRLWTADMPTNRAIGNKDLGWMLYDMRYHQDYNPKDTRITPRFFRAKLKNGILDCDHQEVIS